MMSERLYIDGIDVYEQFGVYVSDVGSDGGFCSLIAFPPLKPFEQNEWAEEDGIEADLSAPVLDSREVAITFAYSDIFNGYDDFIAHLSDGAYHVFDVASIKRRYTLRLISPSNSEYARSIGRETLKFADDYPLEGYQYQVPTGGMFTTDDYLIDGRPTSDYGLRILQGSLSEIQKTPSVKLNMLRSIKSKAGSIYDSKNVFYKAKDVKLNCLMRADSLPELWRNYDALLFDLTRPDERTLSVKAVGQDYPCCYRSSQVTEFFPDGKIWLKFTLTLTFTHGFRPAIIGVCLAAESGYPIVTEDGLLLIDLIPEIRKHGFFLISEDLKPITAEDGQSIFKI